VRLQAQLARQKALPVYEPAIGPDIEVGPILAEQLVIELVQLDRAADQAIDHQALRDRRVAADMRDELTFEVPDKAAYVAATVDRITYGPAAKCCLFPRRRPSSRLMMTASIPRKTGPSDRRKRVQLGIISCQTRGKSGVAADTISVSAVAAALATPVRQPKIPTRQSGRSFYVHIPVRAHLPAGRGR
jgi:hypothetical protein